MTQKKTISGLAAHLRSLAAGEGSPQAVRLYILGYVLVLTAIFTGAVALLQSVLEETRLRNVEASRQETLLKMLNLIEPGQNPDREEIGKLFEINVRVISVPDEEMIAPDGTRQPYVYYSRYGNSDLKVIPVWGGGFWGLMAGYLAIDERTGEIQSLEFLRHEETPGLGGRIGDEDVKARFTGVTYQAPDTRGRRIRMVPEGTSGSSLGAVDTITGATGTSRSVESILNTALEHFLKLRKEGR